MAELVAEMELAAMSEQYSQAKLMQDEYRRRVATAVGQVEEINMKFYRAFSMGDLEEMKQVRAGPRSPVARTEGGVSAAH